ncbi:hypothetical protein IW261DRAFT_1466123 [Armillaria novae-zelandiae]|uniref:Uncharacterized protein n=1 Tax=Armillaria novae-zelandiae TaxID=153914 RepID=A0AA39UEJ9_9AGAR|nr:hypothetical protein IW261DRAFT_1466123 [Armillaria novae-zelandiae]
MYTDALFGFLTQRRIVLQSSTVTVYYFPILLRCALHYRNIVDVCSVGGFYLPAIICYISLLNPGPSESAVLRSVRKLKLRGACFFLRFCLSKNCYAAELLFSFWVCFFAIKARR